MSPFLFPPPPPSPLGRQFDWSAPFSLPFFFRSPPSPFYRFFFFEQPEETPLGFPFSSFHPCGHVCGSRLVPGGMRYGLPAFHGVFLGTIPLVLLPTTYTLSLGLVYGQGRSEVSLAFLGSVEISGFCVVCGTCVMARPFVNSKSGLGKALGWA